MPRISSFYGIDIEMYFGDHLPPHFHARYGEHEARIVIATGAVSADGFPAERPAWSASGRRSTKTSSATAGSARSPARRQVASSL